MLDMIREMDLGIEEKDENHIPGEFLHPVHR